MKKTCSEIQARKILQSFLRNAKNKWIVCPACLIKQISVIDKKKLTRAFLDSGEKKLSLACFSGAPFFSSPITSSFFNVHCPAHHPMTSLSA